MRNYDTVVRILQHVERQDDMSQTWIFEKGDLNFHGHIDDEYGWLEVDYG